MRPLNDKQRRFAAEYLVDLNSKQAAIRAGYSVRTAAQIGSRLLTHVEVQRLVGEGRARLLERTELSIDAVVRELQLIAFARLAHAATWDGDNVTLIASEDLAEAERAAVSEVSKTEVEIDGVVKRSLKIKMHSKLEALEKLMKRLNAYPPKQLDLTSKGEKIPFAAWEAALQDAGEDEAADE